MSSSYIDLPQAGAPGYLRVVPTLADLPALSIAGYVIEVADADGAGNPNFYQWNGTSNSWVVVGTGGSPSVISVNTQTGVVSLTTDDVPEGAVNKYLTTGNNNTVAGFDGSGNLHTIPGFYVDTTTGGLSQSFTLSPNNAAGYNTVDNVNVNLDPIANSPNDVYVLSQVGVNIDSASGGFSLGTGGTAVQNMSLSIRHHGTSTVGSLNQIDTSFDLGNGVDPISVNGFSYVHGFGSVASGVSVTGSVQGYGFQPNFAAGSSLGASSYINAFFDYSSVGIPLGASYSSFSASPTISEVPTGTSYIGLQINPTVGLNKSTIEGININVGNVTNDPGAHASVVFQDITYTSLQAGGYDNGFTVEYTNTTTAGNEVATGFGQTITVSIQSGVSTAAQVLTALANNLSIGSNISYAITGTASNPQVTAGPTNFSGGVDPGRTYAARFVGDVDIQGNLSFTGNINLGAINSYAPYTIVSGTGGVQSVDLLITTPTVPPGATVTAADTIGVNTAALMSFGAASTTTTSFLGISALGLPAVVDVGLGATVDVINGAAFALSFGASGGSGTVDTANACLALAIPDGVTAVNKLRGFSFSLPFGDPGTVTHGVHISPTSAHNYMARDLKVGDGADVVSNNSVGIELESTTKAILMSRMTTLQKVALTAIAGMAVYDTTLNQLSYYNGTVWVNV